MCKRASTRTRQIGHLAPPALRSSEAQGPHIHLKRVFFFFWGGGGGVEKRVGGAKKNEEEKKN